MQEADKQNSESIRELINNIDKSTVALPEFQRDFVWDINRSYDLFDSLCKDIFIGPIIYGIPSFEVTVREIDKRDRKASGKRRRKLETISYSKEQISNKVNIEKFKLILDGQQRVTSIYRALKGFDKIWFIVRNEIELDESNIDKEFHQLTLEDILYEFNGQEDDNRLSLKLSDVYTAMEKGFFDDEVKENYFDNLRFVSNLNDVEKNINFRRFNLTRRKIEDLFKAEKLISYYLLNMDSEKFALFFERSNSRGMQLNFIDILAAKLYSGFNFRDEMEKLRSNYTNYKFERETLVRSISYLVSESEVLKGKAKNKRIDREYILNNLNYHDFNNYWEEVCQLYLKVIDFLINNHYIISQVWMPYENIIIPLIIFLRELPSKDFSQINEKQKEFLEYWYWSVVFTQRYGGVSNETIVQDANVLKQIARNKKISNRLYFNKLKIQMNSSEDILAFSKSNNSVYKGILNIMNFVSEGLRDWNSTNILTANSKLEDHHIFPKDYIKSQFKNDEHILESVDCIANKTLIPKITNIKIGKKSPSTYLKELQRNNPKIVESLKTHLIPAEILDGLYDEFYLDFLETRSKAIFNLIEEVVIKKVDKIEQDFYEPTKVKGNNIIKIFGTYYKKRVEATFNIETKEIFFNGVKYTSVYTAADAAKLYLTGKEDTSTNGWKFWAYLTEDGKECYIDDYRY